MLDAMRSIALTLTDAKAFRLASKIKGSWHTYSNSSRSWRDLGSWPLRAPCHLSKELRSSLARALTALEASWPVLAVRDAD
jgi:transposase